MSGNLKPSSSASGRPSDAKEPVALYPDSTFVSRESNSKTVEEFDDLAEPKPWCLCSVSASNSNEYEEPWLL